MKYLLLILLSAMWGFSYTFIKFEISIIDKNAFQIWRYFIAVITLLLIFRKDILNMSFLSFKQGFKTVGISAFLAAFFTIIGIDMSTTASKAVFIVSMPIVIVPILQYIHRRKRLTRIQLFSALICLTGVFLMTEPWKGDFRIADFVLLLGSISYSYLYLSIEKYANKEKASINVFVQTVTSFIGFSFVGLVNFSLGKFDFKTIIVLPEMKSYLSIIFVGAIITALGWYLLSYVQKDLPVTIVVIILALEPVFTMLSDWIVLKDILKTNEIIGGLFILLAVILVQIKKKTKVDVRK